MKKPEEIDIGFRIDHKKLWELDLPAQELLVEKLNHNLDIPYLEKEDTDDWNLSINQLLENLGQEPTHFSKMKNSDLAFPIDIYKYKGQWIILDGVHRLAKAIWLGNESIKVREVPERLICCIKNS